MTYSGKLYKCIVAVTQPEAFNVNKWDDVTTSEVYARYTGLNINPRINIVSTDVIAEKLAELLFDNFDDIGVKYARVLIVRGTDYFQFNFNEKYGTASNGSIKLFNVNMSAGNWAGMENYLLSNNVQSRFAAIIHADNSVTVDTNLPTAGNDGYIVLM